MTLKIHPIPAGFESGMNNLMWLITGKNNNNAILVDPGYATEATQYLAQQQFNLTSILITHHHYDHTDGVNQLLSQHKGIPVYGPNNSPFQGISHPLADGQNFSPNGIDIDFKVIATPGHTLDHIAYYSSDNRIVFAGDAVFGAGCGILLEGTPEQLLQSVKTIAELPEETEIHYGHDYTLSNLKFALDFEPENQAIISRVEQSKQLKIADSHCSVAIERLTNPFLRCSQPTIWQACEKKSGKTLQNEIDVFILLRKWR